MTIVRQLKKGVIGAALLLTTLYCAASEEQTQRDTREIIVLGDSLSAAYGMTINQGWVALASEQLAQSHPDVVVINASISGETSAGGLARLPALLNEHTPEWVLIELGANDGLRGYPPARLKENLQAMTTMAQEAGAEVILVEMKIPPNYGKRYIDAISNSFRQVATASGSRLIPFLPLDVANNPALIQSDGLHPSAKAQPLIAEYFLPIIREAIDKS